MGVFVCLKLIHRFLAGFLHCANILFMGYKDKEKQRKYLKEWRGKNRAHLKKYFKNWRLNKKVGKILKTKVK